MTENTMKKTNSAFDEFGLTDSIKEKVRLMQELYASDNIPWVVGYSGGKDSTAVTQLVWLALREMKPVERRKAVYVISTDTLVENPVVSAWVLKSIEKMKWAAEAEGLPIYPQGLTPDIPETFWVNLIGRGYPAPRPKFRWCTDRMKIKPVNKFINTVVKESGEAILVLGTRKAESSARAGLMKKYEENRKRDLLSAHTSLTNAYVFAPIADWANDDVWIFLMQHENPWGYDNNQLLNMYRGATEDNECPLVSDKSTPSCGDSRFGCWVCTMVEQDKSMAAMIKNDDEKEWMRPLLDFRNELDKHDHDKRDFRRMSGNVQLFTEEDRVIPGPYTQKSRAELLRKLLRAQQEVHMNEKAPKEARAIDLITKEELDEIRRIWVVDKNEIEDLLPVIYEEAVGEKFSAKPIDDAQPFGAEEMNLLKSACNGDDLHYELVRDLLEIARRYRSMARRANLFERVDDAISKSFYVSQDDATDRAVRKREFKKILERVAGRELSNEEAIDQANQLTVTR